MGPLERSDRLRIERAIAQAATQGRRIKLDINLGGGMTVRLLVGPRPDFQAILRERQGA